MKRIVKISLLVLLTFGLVGCGRYELSPINDGRKNAMIDLLAEIDGGKYEIVSKDANDLSSFVDIINDLKLDNIDYVKRKDKTTAVVKFKSSKKEESSKKLETKLKQEKIIEKDGKEYKVTIEEIIEDSADEIAEEVVSEIAKTSQ